MTASEANTAAMAARSNQADILLNFYLAGIQTAAQKGYLYSDFGKRPMPTETRAALETRGYAVTDSRSGVEIAWETV